MDGLQGTCLVFSGYLSSGMVRTAILVSAPSCGELNLAKAQSAIFQMGSGEGIILAGSRAMAE